MNNILILTYPRTGQHLLRSLFYKTNANYDWSHNVDSDKFKWKSDPERPFYDGSQKVITIVRDPKDAIASYIVYNIFQYDDLNIKNIIKSLTYFEADRYISDYLKLTESALTKEYVMFWEYMVKITDVYIDYNSLVSNQNNVMYKLSNMFDFNYNPDKKDAVLDYKKHIMSSRDHEYYNIVLESVSQFDLKKCYDIYNVCKSKCIKVGG